MRSSAGSSTAPWRCRRCTSAACERSCKCVHRWKVSASTAVCALSWRLCLSATTASTLARVPSRERATPQQRSQRAVRPRRGVPPSSRSRAGSATQLSAHSRPRHFCGLFAERAAGRAVCASLPARPRATLACDLPLTRPGASAAPAAAFAAPHRLASPRRSPFDVFSRARLPRLSQAEEQGLERVQTSCGCVLRRLARHAARCMPTA
jgi:hypothetical protein